MEALMKLIEPETPEDIPEKPARRKKIRIKDMNMEQLRPMLCGLKGNDPNACAECGSLEGCPAGKRACELLGIRKDWRNMNLDRAIAKRKDTRDEYAREAAESGDPVVYVMRKEGVDYITAYYKVYRWKKDVPEIMKDAVIRSRREVMANMEKLPQEAAKPPEAPQEAPQEVPKDADFLALLDRKTAELEKERQELLQRVAKLEEQIDALEKVRQIL